MNTSEILSKIKTLLGGETHEVALAQMKLMDGLTIVESESFKAEDSISIITEDGKVAMPEGSYELEDGRLLIVKQEGIIFEVKEKEEEEKEDVKEDIKEDIEKETKSETKEEYSEENTTPKKVIESITKESFFAEIEKLKNENNVLRKEIEDLKLSAEDKTEEVETEKTEETKLATIEEVSPIVHNPENKKTTEGFKFAQNRNETTFDRVLKRLNK